MQNNQGRGLSDLLTYKSWKVTILQEVFNSFPAISLHAPDRNAGRRAAPHKGSPERTRDARATLGHTRKYIDTSEVVRLIFRETMFVVFILRNNETQDS